MTNVVYEYVYGLALGCFAVGTYVLLHVLADYLDAKAERKRRELDLDR